MPACIGFVGSNIAFDCNSFTPQCVFVGSRHGFNWLGVHPTVYFWGLTGLFGFTDSTPGCFLGWCAFRFCGVGKLPRFVFMAVNWVP